MGKKPLQINKKCQIFQTEKNCVRNLNAYENQQRYCKFALDCYLLLSSIETVQTQEKQQKLWILQIFCSRKARSEKTHKWRTWNLIHALHAFVEQVSDKEANWIFAHFSFQLHIHIYSLQLKDTRPHLYNC